MAAASPRRWSTRTVPRSAACSRRHQRRRWRRLFRRGLQRQQRRVAAHLQHRRWHARGGTLQHGGAWQRRRLRERPRRRRRAVRPARPALAFHRVFRRQQHAVHLRQFGRQPRRHDLDALRIQHARLPRLPEVRCVVRRLLHRRERRPSGVCDRPHAHARGPDRDPAAQGRAGTAGPRFRDDAAGLGFWRDTAARGRAGHLHPHQRRRTQLPRIERSSPGLPAAVHADRRLHDACQYGARGSRVRGRGGVEFAVQRPRRFRCDPPTRHLAAARSVVRSADGAGALPQPRRLRGDGRQPCHAPARRHHQQHRRRALVRAAPHRRARQSMGDAPAGHVRTGRRRWANQPLDGRDRHGRIGKHRDGLQRRA